MSKVACAKNSIRGNLYFPGDKSIAHRALILASITHGVSILDNLPESGDVKSTMRIMRTLGARIENITGNSYQITGFGNAPMTPTNPLDCGNSGTTMRLLCGLLAGFGVEATLIGDASLSTRPMERVAKPLRRMGAAITTTQGHAPIVIKKGSNNLRAISHESPTPSAQVKTALMLAALFADGKTSVSEADMSRDHTERLFEYLGLPIFRSVFEATVIGTALPRPFTLTIPGDPSSAAYFVAAVCIHQDAEIQCRNTLYNPRRLGFFYAAKTMGADIRFDSQKPCGPENTASIMAKSSKLRGIEIGGQLALDALDELPLLAALATFAHGTTIIRDAAELRNKESDRISATARMIKSLGGEVEEMEDGWKIVGPQKLHGGVIDPVGDHRIAMTASIIGTRVGGVQVKDLNLVKISNSGFFDQMKKLGFSDPPTEVEVPHHQVIIAIDGPSGSGKSTISRELAARLSLTYIDTGAMYRCVGLMAKRAGLKVDQSPALKKLLDTLRIRFEQNDDLQRVYIGDEDVTEDIRDHEVSRWASDFSALPAVRKHLVEMQRRMGRQGGVVMEGRDIGTNVFPNAHLKIFLTADENTRARRRMNELISKGHEVEFETILADQHARDEKDANRALNPLVQADDAIALDTTDLSIQEVVLQIADKATSRRKCLT
jgi:3-phosphoshikimate 1-carboxyvinyltransferase